MQHVRKVWEANPGSQRLFLSCSIREALYHGTRGNGKTDALLMDFAQHCGVGFGSAWRGVLFRKTYKQLDEVMVKAKRWFYQIFPGIRLSGYTWKWPTGEELLLRHFDTVDDYWNYHGHEYPWIGWEELTNWADLEGYEAMLACNRSSHPGVPRKVRATTNPFGIGHNAVKKYFIEPAPTGQVYSEEREIPMLENDELVRRKVLVKRVAIHGSYIENPKLLVADPYYLANIDRISDPAKRKAWMFGDWDIPSGGMFDDLWDSRVHVIRRPFGIPKSWRIDRSLDWGTSAPFSVGWWAESDGTPVEFEDGQRHTYPRGSLLRFAEWYGCTGKANEGIRMTSTKVAQGIIERQRAMKIHERCRPGPADSQIFNVADDVSTASNFASEGVQWLEADKKSGSRKNGVDIMRSRLEASAKDEGKPGIYVLDRCRDFLRTVPSLPRSEKDPEDVDTSAEDHVWDETMYRLIGPRPATATVTSLRM